MLSGLATCALVFASSDAAAATVQQITGFGSNPTGIGMYLYTPTNVAAKPAIVVGVHACHGKGTDVCTPGGAFAAQADRFGFLLVCPSAVSSDGCWDVHSTADLTHNGGGDAAGIISMVTWVVQNRNGDANRVYAAGHSSGGMMTNILLGSYPDVFKAGAAYAGVAFGCFATGPVDSLGWNASCANGNVTKTGVQWGDQVRSAFPGFTGTRPRIQLWHGTVDLIVNFHNLGEEIKEWTNVLGVSETPTSTENNALQSTWIRTRYTNSAGQVQVEAIQETGQPHNLVVNAAEAIRFFGLDGTTTVVDAGALDARRDALLVDASDASMGIGGMTGAGGTPGRGSGGATGIGGSTGRGGSSGVGGQGAGGGDDAGGPGTGGASVRPPGRSDAASDVGAGQMDNGSASGCSAGCSFGGLSTGVSGGRSGGRGAGHGSRRSAADLLPLLLMGIVLLVRRSRPPRA